LSDNRAAFRRDRLTCANSRTQGRSDWPLSLPFRNTYLRIVIELARHPTAPLQLHRRPQRKTGDYGVASFLTLRTMPVLGGS